MPTNGGSKPIEAIFKEIEEAQVSSSVQSGVVYRRIHPNSSCDLFVGIRKPLNTRLFVARFHVSAIPDVFDLPEFRSLEVIVHREFEGDTEMLTATISSPQTVWNDIFTSLGEDIARAVSNASEESGAANAFRRRLQQWQVLLQRTGTAGLTVEQQQGLYGELWCLRELLLPHLEPEVAVRAWLGPESADQDFQFVSGVAVEVKTTRSAEPQTLAISSERQLDDASWKALFILHISLDRAHGAGETLPQAIDALTSMLAFTPGALAAMQDKLLTAGYLDLHTDRYRDVGYTIHTTHIYRVFDGFPRIVESDLAPGVGHVRYVISAAACLPFTANIETVAAEIKDTP